MDSQYWTDTDGRLRDKRGRFAKTDGNGSLGEVISHRHDPSAPIATAATTDPSLAQQFEQFKAEQSQQLKAIRDELAKLNKSSGDTNQRVKRGFESVEEKLCWDALLQDAIMASCICLIVGSMAAYRWVATDGVVQAREWVLKFTPNLFDKPMTKLLDEWLPVTEAYAATTEGAIALPVEQQAFLNTIAQAEGADYTTIYGGSTFTDFSDHPRQCIPINVPGYEGKCSDAAGRYQILSTTWKAIADELGLTDFSPESQTRAAIALIEETNAFTLLDRGDVGKAFCAVGKIWASLPCNSYGQGAKSEAEVTAMYEANLAELRTAKPAALDVQVSDDGAIAITDSAPLKTSDMIGTFRVTRGIIPGEHEGVDLATPEGTPLFVFGEKGEKITVECHEQMNGGSYSGWGVYGTFHVPSINKSFLVGHLSECNAGTYDAGSVWGYSGNTGKSTGPHTHIEQYTGKDAGIVAKPEEPTRVFVEEVHGVK